MKLAVIAAALLSSTVFAAKIEMPLPKGTKVIQVGASEKIKTLEAALEAVKEIRKSDTKTPLALCVAPGEYAPTNQLFFTKEIASTNFGRLFVYAKDFEKKPRIHGGDLVTGWKKVKFNGRSDVWCADASKLTLPKRPRLLFINGQRMQPARWPNLDPKNPYTTGFAHAIGADIDDVVFKFYGPEMEEADKAGKKRSDVIKFFADEILMRPNDIRKWAHPEDGWCNHVPEHNYWIRFSELKSLSNNVIRVFGEKHNPLGGYNRYDRYWVENVAEELDYPNEWYFDPRERKVYILPEKGVDPNKSAIAFAKETTMIMFPNGAGNCTLAGLELTSGYEGIRISNAKFIDVIACSIHDIGFQSRGGCNESNGIFIISENVTVRDCDIYNIGAWGVFVHSYGPCKIDYRSNVRIENNYFHHCGVVDTGAGAVRNAGTGVTVKNNLMHDFPRAAVCGYGRFSELSYNRIRHMNTTGDDTGATYDAAWTSCVGSKLFHNWISDSIGYKRDMDGTYRHYDGACGIYFDECSGGAEVYGNLVENCHMSGMHLHNGRWITISNNVFVSNGMIPKCDYTMQFSLQPWNRDSFKGGRRNYYSSEYKNFVKNDPRWRTLPAIAQDPEDDNSVFSKHNGSLMHGVKVINNIFYYPEAADRTFMHAPGVDPTTNVINRNVIWAGKDVLPKCRHNRATEKGKYWEWDTWEEWKKDGFDTESLLEDPLFEDPAKRDFRLKADSPAFKLGFKELPYEKIGLQKTYFRPELPVEAEGMREHPEWVMIAEKVTEYHKLPKKK